MKWEYYTYATQILNKEPFNFEKDFKALGEDGWELINTMMLGDSFVAFFKRQTK